MGSSWGIGFIRHHAHAITSREQAVTILTRFAEAVGDRVHDVVDGEAIEVTYWGSASPIADLDRAQTLLAAMKAGGDLTFDELTKLDPFYACMVCDSPFHVDVGKKRVEVMPLKWLVDRLHELVAQDPGSRETFEAVLETCKTVQALDTILVVGDP